MDRDGVALLLPPEETKEELPRMKHVWLDSGYNGANKGKDWIEQNLGSEGGNYQASSETARNLDNAFSRRD